MIRRELEKERQCSDLCFFFWSAVQDPELQNENWDRFLPHFKNRNVQRKKMKDKKAVRDPACADVMT